MSLHRELDLIASSMPIPLVGISTLRHTSARVEPPAYEK